MRVLVVVHGFPPAATGGTELYVRDYARALAACPDTEVCVLTREADASRPEHALRVEQRDGLSIAVVNNTFQACASFEESYANPLLAAAAARAIDAFAPDVAHVQHLTCLSTRILDVLAARGIPIVMTLNDYWLICHRGQLFTAGGHRCGGPFDDGCEACVPAGSLASPAAFRLGRAARASTLPGAALAVHAGVKALEALPSTGARRAASVARLQHMRTAARAVDLFLAPSATLEQWFVRFGIERERLARCEQGIDLRPFASLQRRDSRVLRIGYAGALIPSKAPHVLLDAVAQLPPGAVSVDLLGSGGAYHGDASYDERLAPLVGLPFVRKLGPVPHERMPRALADIDALVVPSAWIENAPFVIREAFAAGAPVIAANLGGMAEMVRHGVDGLLFEPDDPAALAAHLRDLAAEPSRLDRLRRGVRRPMAIEEDARAGRERYRQLLAASGRGADAPEVVLPPSGGSTPSAGSTPSGAAVTAVVLNYRTPDQTWLAVRSLQTSSLPLSVLVVDNDSGDGSAERLRATLPGVQVIETGANLGFSGGCNVGVRAALEGGADYVLLVNSDVVLAPDAVAALLHAADRNPAAGILAPVLLAREEPDRIASAGIAFAPSTGRMRHVAAGQPMGLLPPGPALAADAVSGCVMLIRRDLFARAGFLDEEYFFSFEDIDLCLRARDAGFAVLCVPGAVAYHEGGRSIGRRSPDRVYFATRNHLRLARRGARRTTAPLRGAFIVALNAAYVLLAGETPRVRGLAAVARGAWHHLAGRYGPS